MKPVLIKNYRPRETEGRKQQLSGWTWQKPNSRRETLFLWARFCCVTVLASIRLKTGLILKKRSFIIGLSLFQVQMRPWNIIQEGQLEWHIWEFDAKKHNETRFYNNQEVNSKTHHHPAGLCVCSVSLDASCRYFCQNLELCVLIPK